MGLSVAGKRVGTGRGRWLTCCGGENDQSCPVIFDELAHGVYSREFKRRKDSGIQQSRISGRREQLRCNRYNVRRLVILFPVWAEQEYI